MPDRPHAPGAHAYRDYAIAWLGLAAVAVANGALREALLAKRLGGRPAHQVSSATGAAALGAATVALERRRPIERARTAAGIGAMWVVMTIAFETLMGRVLRRLPWSDVLGDYDLRRGRVWGVVVLWIGLLPSLARWLRLARARSGP